MISDYLEWVSQFVLRHGYTTVFIGMLLENIFGLGLFFPGILILLMGGFYAGTGELGILQVLIFGFLGILVGDNLSYLFGRIGIIKLPIIRKHSSYLEKIEKAIREKNKRFLVFFHFPVYSRMIVPAFLGVLKFNLRDWLLLDALGALIFSSTFSLVGFIIGISARTFEQAIDISNYIQYGFLVFLAWWTVSVIREIKNLK